MVCLVYFGYNLEIVVNNVFQSLNFDLIFDQVEEKVFQEFDIFVFCFCDVGVQVYVVEDIVILVKLDVIFFNNWVIFYQDGMVVIYLMYVLICWKECREDVIEQFFIFFEVINWV